jgi:hypothetical protein
VTPKFVSYGNKHLSGHHQLDARRRGIIAVRAGLCYKRVVGF